ncbi:MAG: DUF5658 family protein [Bryobacteraceae bacterium]
MATSTSSEIRSAPATAGNPNAASGWMYFRVFVYLQLLDALTTLLGFRLGAQEASPIVRMLTDSHPVAGLAISKAAAFLLLALCYWTGRFRVISWINYWFAALVVWNVCVLLLVA